MRWRLKKLDGCQSNFSRSTGPDQYDIVTWSGKAEEKAGYDGSDRRQAGRSRSAGENIVPPATRTFGPR